MMQVLIVEDEAILRKGIISLIDWKQFGCEIAGDVANGRLALDVIAEKKIDLVVTDIKMPQMDGLELSRILYETRPEIGIIILSAFKDFNYAKQAIQYSILNYVLKSDFVHELPEAVESAVFTLRQRESMVKRELGVNDERLAQILFEKLLEGDVRETDALLRLFKRMHLDCAGYFLLLAELDHQEYTDFTSEPLRPDMDTENFFSLAFQEYPHFCCSLGASLVAVLVGMEQDTGNSQYSLVLKCNEILATAQNFLSFDVNMGLSGRFTGIEALPGAYKQAKEALGGTHKKAPSLAVFGAAEQQNGPKKNLPDIKQVSERLLYAMAGGNSTETDTVLAELFASYDRDRVKPENIRVQLLLLFSQVHLHHLNSGFQIGNIDAIIVDSYTELRNVLTVYAMEKTAKTFVARVLENSRPTAEASNPLVSQVNQYIAENYAQNIKLDTLAEYLHVSSSYLSRLYKKKTGMSIITYLNGYRVEKAKKLFAGGESTVADVGYRVGFDNPAYFTHVFTKYAGRSPKTYCRELVR